MRFSPHVPLSSANVEVVQSMQMSKVSCFIVLCNFFIIIIAVKMAQFKILNMGILLSFSLESVHNRVSGYLQNRL